MTFLVSDELKARIRQRQAAASAGGENTEATQLKRDLEGPRVALGTKGRAGGPGIVRYDAGVYLGYDLEHALSREASRALVDQVDLVIGAGSTTDTQAFSFSEDHFILGITFEVSSSSANIESFGLWASPFSDPEDFPLAIWNTANDALQVCPDTAGSNQALALLKPRQVFVTWPLFGLQETDYTITGRTNAGGGATVKCYVYHTEADKGVRIPGR